jgi:hypothetical protein
MVFIGLPLINSCEIKKIRSFINEQLDQHPHKPIAEIPKWIFSKHLLTKSNKKTIQNVKCAALFIEKNKEVDLGIFILVVLPNGSASLVNEFGTCFFVGLSKCVSIGGCVILVHFSRGTGLSLFGGTLVIIDVLSFDNINYTEKPLQEKINFFEYLHQALYLPSRYVVKSCKFIIGKDAQMMVDLYKDNLGSAFYALCDFNNKN